MATRWKKRESVLRGEREKGEGDEKGENDGRRGKKRENPQ